MPRTPAPVPKEHTEKEVLASDILLSLFSVPEQHLVRDYSCALSESFLLHGRMFITNDAVMFYSGLFGREVRKILPFERIVRIERRAHAYVIPALHFIMAVRGGGEKRIAFSSFFGSYRDDCHSCCLSQLALHRMQCPELYSITDAPPAVSSSTISLENGSHAEDAAPEAPLLVASTAADAVPTFEGGSLLGGCAAADADAQPPDDFWAQLRTSSIVLDVVVPLPPQEFYAHFIGDGAGFSMAEAHRARGDYAVSQGDWVENTQVHSSSTTTATAGGRIRVSSSEAPGGDPFVTRTIRLRMRLDPMPFTPKETTVEKVQRLSRWGSGSAAVAAIETSATSFDVPYGDYFVVRDFFVAVPHTMRIAVPDRELPQLPLVEAADASFGKVLREMQLSARDSTAGDGAAAPASSEVRPLYSQEGGGGGAVYTRLLVGVRVDFSRYTVFKSRIAASAEEGARSFYALYERNALEYLESRIFEPWRQQATAVGLRPLQIQTHDGAAAVLVASARKVADDPSAALVINATNGALALPANVSCLSGTHSAAAATGCISPAAAATADRDTLLRNYSQLFRALDAAGFRQRRGLNQTPESGSGASSVSHAENVVELRVSLQPRILLLFIAALILVVTVLSVMLWKTQPAKSCSPDAGCDIAALVDAAFHRHYQQS